MTAEAGNRLLFAGPVRDMEPRTGPARNGARGQPGRATPGAGAPRGEEGCNMASGYTTYYGLCQWQPEDQFLREEFNGDNAKIDTVLGRTERMLLGFHQNFSRIIYPLFDSAMRDYTGGYAYTSIKTLFLESFDNQDRIASLGGRITIQLGNIVLPWDADPASMTTVPLDLTGVIWSHATIWIRCEPQAAYGAAVNGISGTQTGKRTVKTSDDKVECAEIQFDVEVPDGGSSAVVALTLTAIEHTPPRIYEYGVFFF